MKPGPVAFVSLCCFLTLAGVTPGQAQGQRIPLGDIGVYRDTLDVRAAQPFVLRPFLLPGSERVILGGMLLDSTAYRLDRRHGRLWLNDPPAETSLVVTYRTFPFQFANVYRRRSIDEAGERGAVVVEEARPPAPAMDPFAGSRLQRSGSITRGILAGSSRDVTLESGLRMQLAGEIVDGVNIQAVLTDENTPILPEGTTQRIEEFDRVFIQIDGPPGTAQLGDFDLAFTGSEFARFSRKLQGVTLRSDLVREGLFSGGELAVAGATARGIFHSQDVRPIDGVQGPYRLEGKAGERFILIVPGSENVYLDGVRLTRGESHDYVVDYATAEIAFTTNRLVTADHRIRVEFQYTTNSFTRTIMGSEGEAHFWRRADGAPRARLGATFLREADGRAFTGEMGFSAADSLRLIDAGDGPAFASGAERVIFDPEAPYAQYTVQAIDGALDSIFVSLATAPAAGVPVYRVRFSHVGPGEGRYERSGRSGNGIQYEYRGPGLGAYEPVRVLPKPKDQQLFDVRGGFQPLPGIELFGEIAHSVHDRNRLSALDGADDEGSAYIAGARLAETAVSLGKVDLGRLSASAERRFTGGTFESFDRIRPVEFDRRWNLMTRHIDVTGGVLGGGDEIVDEARLRLDVTGQSSLRGEGGRIRLGDGFTAERLEGALVVAEGGLPYLGYRIEGVGSRDALAGEEGNWLRQRGTLRHALLGGRLVPILEIERERRRQYTLETDSLARPSFAFTEYRPGMAWVQGRLEVGGSLEMRREEDWAEGELRDAATAWTALTHFAYRGNRSFQTDGSIGYRARRFKEYFRLHDRRENNESLVMRWNTRYQPLQRAVQLNGLYEARTERTPTLQEIYVRTGPELGQYVWEDANGDGLVQIDEFVPERLPNEGTYVRTFVPSDTLTSVVSVQARLRLELDPARLWKGPQQGWRRWVSRVAGRTTIEVQEKSRDDALAQIYLLNLSRFRDPVNTLSGRLRVAQDVFLFRDEARYSVDLSFSQLRTLNALAAGLEDRLLNSWRAEGRYKPTTRWGMRTVAALERNRVESEQFASRRHDITTARIEPEVSYAPSRTLQLLAGAVFAVKEDGMAGRRARIVRLPLELRHSLARRLMLTARAEAASVRLEGDPVGMARFELTDGRGPGTSFLWNVGGQYNVNQFLRASFSYDGRAPAGAPVLHTMRLQLSAVF